MPPSIVRDAQNKSNNNVFNKPCIGCSKILSKREDRNIIQNIKENL